MDRYRNVDINIQYIDIYRYIDICIYRYTYIDIATRAISIYSARIFMYKFIYLCARICVYRAFA